MIGGGPSGLGVLCWFAKLKREGKVRIGKFGDSSLRFEKIPTHPYIVSVLYPISIQKVFAFVIFGLGWGESTITKQQCFKSMSSLVYLYFSTKRCS